MTKGIVFCHTCNEIVGDSFPVQHYHKDYGNGSGAIYMLDHNMLGFSYYKDTPKVRRDLVKLMPPRKEIVIAI